MTLRYLEVELEFQHRTHVATTNKKKVIYSISLSWSVEGSTLFSEGTFLLLLLWLGKGKKNQRKGRRKSLSHQ